MYTNNCQGWYPGGAIMRVLDYRMSVFVRIGSCVSCFGVCFYIHNEKQMFCY